MLEEWVVEFQEKKISCRLEANAKDKDGAKGDISVFAPSEVPPSKSYTWQTE